MIDSGASPEAEAQAAEEDKMDQETAQRLEALEARVLRLEGQPVATLEVTETKPKTKRVTNRKPLTPEEKQEHVDRLRKGKLAAAARRAEQAQMDAQIKAKAERSLKDLEAQAPSKLKVKVHTPDELAEADAKADIAAVEQKPAKMVGKKEA